MTNATEDRDERLVAAIATRDEAAFTELYRHYLPVILRWCLRETGNREIAADLSAEVFAAALISARRYRAQRGSVLAWLLGIAQNKLLESRRRKRVEDSARRRLGLEPMSLTDADLDRVEELASLDEEILELVEGLSAPLRQALAARVVHERSYEEIAFEMHCSPSVARQRVSRALKSLKSQMEKL
jgi:RNA polymerase sigma factor (sigma-70 family)